MKLKQLLSVALFVALSGAWSPARAATYDVLQLPAAPSEMASRALIYAIQQFNGRHFAVGQFGHILYSDDVGETWTQAQVPVRSSILDIDFATPELGWAVGHEGVILHTTDGGKTWVKQYDGLRYGEEGRNYYSSLAKQEPDNELYPWLVQEMEFAIAQGADKPLFKVAFHTEKHGHAFGAYGMILRTDDGGEHWRHVLHRTDNDTFYHLFDFAPLREQGKFFISGEAGLLMIGDINEEYARKIDTVPWEGSFFTALDAADGSIVLGGLRGNMFRTEDAGQTWAPVEKPPTSQIVDSVRLGDGRLVAVGIGGEILVSGDNGRSFSQLPNSNGQIYAVAEAGPGALLLGGPLGIRKLQLSQ